MASRFLGSATSVLGLGIVWLNLGAPALAQSVTGEKSSQSPVKSPVTKSAVTKTAKPEAALTERQRVLHALEPADLRRQTRPSRRRPGQGPGFLDRRPVASGEH